MTLPITSRSSMRRRASRARASGRTRSMTGWSLSPSINPRSASMSSRIQPFEPMTSNTRTKQVPHSPGGGASWQQRTGVVGQVVRQQDASTAFGARHQMLLEIDVHLARDEPRERELHAQRGRAHRQAVIQQPQVRVARLCVRIPRLVHHLLGDAHLRPHEAGPGEVEQREVVVDRPVGETIDQARPSALEPSVGSAVGGERQRHRLPRADPAGHRAVVDHRMPYPERRRVRTRDEAHRQLFGSRQPARTSEDPEVVVPLRGFQQRPRNAHREADHAGDAQRVTDRRGTLSESSARHDLFEHPRSTDAGRASPGTRDVWGQGGEQQDCDGDDGPPRPGTHRPIQPHVGIGPGKAKSPALARRALRALCVDACP